MSEKYEKRAAYGINMITLVPCFVVKDAELKYTSNGKAYARFSVGYDDSYKNENGVVESKYFFNCVMWGNQAEALYSYLTKGKKIDLVGKLVQKTWEKDGKKNNVIEIIVSTINFRTSAKKDSSDENISNVPIASSNTVTSKKEEVLTFGSELGEDDVPF